MMCHSFSSTQPTPKLSVKSVSATPDLTDNFGVGWVLEKLWHIIFGMDAV
jgi:hypothetical protein